MRQIDLQCLSARWVSFLTLTAVVLLTMSGASATASASARPSAQNGTLAIRVAGLPKRDRASIVLSGPASGPRGARTRRTITKVGTVRIRNLAAGLYRLQVHKVKIRHRSGTIKRGAVATPVKNHLKVRVGGRHTRKLTVRYGTIVNPGLQHVNGHITKIFGNPNSPNAVKLDGGTQVRKGIILSAPPSGRLPQGLLAHVTSVRRVHGASIARLRPAGIYEVAPNMDFNVPVTLDSNAQSSAALVCKTGGGPGVRPYVRISDAWVSGGWTTTRVAFWDVKTGANADLHFRTAAGVEVKVDSSLTCSLPLPSVGFQGMAGPIPVYGAIKPGAKASVSGGASMNAEGSTNVTLGAGIGGVPPTAQPHFSFDSPQFTFKSQLFASANASLSLDAELGIGVANAANLHVALGNSLEFTAAPGNCSWDLNLGTFSAGGQLGPLSISTPSSPPLYHRNLWHRSCGSPPPPPPPGPPAPPPISLPFARATMSWETDSDIDLYAWDQSGNLAYYLEELGIADAELVEDIIPSFGEASHAPEVFQETASPGRTYTFGICVFRGEGGDVTLDVTDPNGSHRSFQRSFFEAGESAVVTTSPDGSGFDPGSDWCSFSD
jgi:hypothetical protein